MANAKARANAQTKSGIDRTPPGNEHWRHPELAGAAGGIAGRKEFVG
jgi:hypothetical protein